MEFKVGDVVLIEYRFGPDWWLCLVIGFNVSEEYKMTTLYSSGETSPSAGLTKLWWFAKDNCSSYKRTII